MRAVESNNRQTEYEYSQISCQEIQKYDKKFWEELIAYFPFTVIRVSDTIS
jgi:hypothetical protein